MTEKEFVERIGNLAVEDMRTSGILASVTTAQACFCLLYTSDAADEL